MESLNIQKIDNLYSIDFRGKLDLFQAFAITESELNSLRELRKHLDTAGSSYKSDDGAIVYKDGVLLLFFDLNNSNNRFNTNVVRITNPREFLDKL